MLRIIAVSAGAVDYLLRGSGCAGHEHDPEHGCSSTGRGKHERGHERGAARYFGAAVENGEPAGRWGGRGLAGLFGIEEGAQASEGFVRSVFGKLEDPRTGRVVGAGAAEVQDHRAAGRGRRWPRSRTRPRSGGGSSSWPRPPMAARRSRTTTSPSPHPSRCRVYYAALLAAGEVEAAAQVAARA